MNANSRGEETAALPIRVDWRPFAVPFSFRLFGLFRGFPFGCGSAALGLCVLKSISATSFRLNAWASNPLP